MPILHRMHACYKATHVRKKIPHSPTHTQYWENLNFTNDVEDKKIFLQRILFHSINTGERIFPKRLFRLNKFWQICWYNCLAKGWAGDYFYVTLCFLCISVFWIGRYGIGGCTFCYLSIFMMVPFTGAIGHWHGHKKVTVTKFWTNND